jgi:hypothetical protein
MLAIARALVGDVQLLILDEPFEGLAPVVVEEVYQAVSSLSGRPPSWWSSTTSTSRWRSPTESTCSTAAPSPTPGLPETSCETWNSAPACFGSEVGGS